MTRLKLGLDLGYRQGKLLQPPFANDDDSSGPGSPSLPIFCSRGCPSSPCSWRPFLRVLEALLKLSSQIFCLLHKQPETTKMSTRKRKQELEEEEEEDFQELPEDDDEEE